MKANPLENNPGALDLSKYDLSNEKDWKAVYELISKGQEAEQARIKIVDIFNQQKVLGYHGTSLENLKGILENGILSRVEYEKKFGHSQTGRWTQQSEEVVSYWDLGEIRDFLRGSGIADSQVLNYTDQADCFLVLASSVQKISADEGGEPTFLGVSLSKQPNERLINGSVKPENIIGVAVNIDDHQVFFENETENKNGVRMIPTVEPLKARKILVESALNATPVYDLGGNLMWPTRERKNHPESEGALTEEQLMKAISFD